MAQQQPDRDYLMRNIKNAARFLEKIMNERNGDKVEYKISLESEPNDQEKVSSPPDQIPRPGKQSSDKSGK